jgi:predicted PurR-regulated permease PerM
MMTTVESRFSTDSTLGETILAIGLVLAFCYFASGVVVTLLVSILIAYLLDPAVEWMERVRIPRTLGALLVVMLALAFLGLLAWLLIERLDDFWVNWPKYRQPLHDAASAIDRRLDIFEARVSEIAPQQTGRNVVQLAEPHPARNILFERLGSLYSAALGTSFVPFLVFFMLAGKTRAYHSTLQLFPFMDRTRIKGILDEVSATLRSYMLGIAMVGAFLVVASSLFFWAVGLDYPILTGLASGLFNLIPYIGSVASLVPPFFIGLRQYHTLPPYLGIAAMLLFFHIVAGNVLFPALVGRRVRLNAVAVTVSLLFWGWMWGGIGLLLGIPITATLKVICDNNDSWRPVGRWLGY